MVGISLLKGTYSSQIIIPHYQKMAALTLEQVTPYLNSWIKASDHEKISLYKQAEEPVRKLYLRSIPHCDLTALGGPPSRFVKFFEELHDSPCDHCKDSDEKCIGGPWQQDAFRVMGIDCAAILANDYDLIYRKGWVRLITSLNDEDIQAKLVIETRYEYPRKKLLEEMGADTRKKVLERISHIQTMGYPTLDGNRWFCVATPTFNSVCGVCGDDYEVGGTIINKGCGVHTSHMKCAEKTWGKRRKDWIANPCQLCVANLSAGKQP
jgi:hypothetical protein